MTKTCLICEKASRMGGKRRLLRGNYNPTKWERKYPNLQWVALPSSNDPKKAHNPKRIKICTKCIKKGDYIKALAK